MDPAKSGLSVADHMHSHVIDKTQSQELSNTSSSDPRPKVPASTQNQQRLPAANNNPPSRPARPDTKPPNIFTRKYDIERPIKSAPAVLEPWQIHLSFSELTEKNDEEHLFWGYFTSHLKRLDAEEPSDTESSKPPEKKKKAKKSAFLQQALAGTQIWCRTPQKPKAVVKQDDPNDCAKLLETAQKAKGVARRLQLAPLPKKRCDKQSLDDRDRRQQSNRILDTTKFLEELEIAVPGVPQVHLAEYAKLFREAADPSIDTRDTEPAPADISGPDSKKKPRKRKQDEAVSLVDPSPERKKKTKRRH